MDIHQLELRRFLLVGTLAATLVGCGSSSPTGPRNGSIRIETTSSGDDLDANGFTISVDQAQPTAIGLFDHLVFSDLGLGSHLVALADVAANCATSAANPQNVDVVGGDTVTVLFPVTCEALAPPGGGGGGQNPLRARIDPSRR